MFLYFEIEDLKEENKSLTDIDIEQLNCKTGSILGHKIKTPTVKYKWAQFTIPRKTDKLEWKSDLEEQLLEISDDGLDEWEDDVVRVQDVDVGGGLAQFDAGDGGGLRHCLGSVRDERLLDDVDELLLPDVLRRAGSAGIGVVDLLQDIGGENLKNICYFWN